MDLHYKNRLFHAVWGIKIACEKLIKTIKHRVGSMPSYNGKASGTYSNHCTLKG